MTAPDVGSIPNWIAAVASCFAVFVAWFQLRKVSESARRQANVVRADLMLKIDQIFEGKEMAESRLAIRTLRNQCEMKAKSERKGANNKDVADRSAKHFSEQMTQLWIQYKTADDALDAKKLDLTDTQEDKEGRRYATLMRLPYWMETVGLLSKKGLIETDDVLDLYDAVYAGVLNCFEGHIKDRRDDQPTPNQRFLEHAVRMQEQAQRRLFKASPSSLANGGKSD